jgi:cation-transporting ATPase E
LDIKGLTAAEVKQRSDEGRDNKSASHKTKTYREIIIENIFSLFNFIIFGIIGFVIFFYIKNNDQRLLLDSIGILFIAFTNVSIALYQEIKSKIALDKVNLLLKKEVTVVRDGKKQKIDQIKIVVDDVIEITRGDQIPADGTVLNTRRLEIDESLLTGESVPIEKENGDVLLSGSFCVAGAGYYQVNKVGDESHAHAVTNLAKKYKFVLTPLQKRINLILKILFGIALILVAVEILTWNAKGTVNGDFVEHIRKIATILISLVPQGLILTASVTFAIGVYKISKIGAIVQKLNAIESFSNVQYVFMDKTGTLTENKLKVHKLTVLNKDITEENLKELLGSFAYHSTEKNATIRALEVYTPPDNSVFKGEMPFSSDTKLSILEIECNNIRNTYILGAYDILISRTEEDIAIKASGLINDGGLGIYRNLLFGKIQGIGAEELFNEITTDKLKLLRIIPLGIISISDTIRADVLDAIKLFEKNGIKFKVLTGDSTESVKAIIKEIGWNVKDDLMISGQELDTLSPEDFNNTAVDKVVFSRLKPEHKLKIINAHKQRNIYTAMIGDGVNDLPAIKQAHIGIAMEEGSAITKEVADIILLKNKFSLLPQIFDEGNRIVNSVNAVAKLFLTKNFLVIYLSLASLIFFMDFPLTPRRVSLLNVFSIGLPAFIITIKNRNISKCGNFTKDVFSFVIISSVLITVFGYTAYYLLKSTLELPEYELEMGMITVLIITAVTNFLIVARDAGGNKLLYHLYGIFLIALFIVLATVQTDLGILSLLRIFYEIKYLGLSDWVVIGTVSAAGSLILIGAQRIREKFVKYNL